MSVNTVALDSERKPILYTEEIPALITKADIDFCSGNGYPGSISVMIQGPVLLTLTNIRLIIVPENDLVKSLDIPLFKLQECVLVRPMFGSRRITATVLPISDGGLPENGQMTIKFPSGNAFEFKTFFDELSAQTAGMIG